MAWLPERLPEELTLRWNVAADSPGVGGLAATEDRVLVTDRGLGDRFDVFKCLDAETGDELWRRIVPAPAKLDYGNSARATPLIHGELATFVGAMGRVSCLKLATGEVVWQRDHVRDDGAADERPWGFSSSPLLAGGRLILNPGGPTASLVAVSPESGRLVWRTPGRPAAFASFFEAELGGRRQLIGYDKTTLGAWSPDTGERLWELVPERPHDFNVPNPLLVDGKLLVSTENNGTRLYAFDADGRLLPEPLARHRALAPDTASLVLAAGKVFGCWDGLYCLDAGTLEERWLADEEDAYRDHVSLLATDERVLVVSLRGELLLLDPTADAHRILGRLQVLMGDGGVYSTPALVGTRLYLRGSARVVCVELGAG